MSKNLILAMAPGLLLLSWAAHPANWIPLGEDARGNAWHLDMGSVVREKDTVTVWKRIDFRQEHPHYQNGGPVKRVFLQGATDCVRQRSTVRAMGLLDAGGSVVAVHEHGGNAIPWPPGTYNTLLQAAMARVCGIAADSGEGPDLNPTP